jgi:hypothetical protein
MFLPDASMLITASVPPRGRAIVAQGATSLGHSPNGS